MNNKINIDKEAMLLLYSRSKNYLVPIGMILFCIALLIFVIIPQIKTVRDLQNQEKEEARRLEILQNNVNLLSGLDSNALDKQLNIVGKILPINKDFISILKGLTIASNKANVALGDYGFQVGDITESSTKSKGTPALELTLIVNGSLSNLIKFIEELENTAPISEVKAVNLTSKNSTIIIDFYYKSLSMVKVKDEAPLNSLSPSVIKLLNDLSKMNNVQLENLEKIAPINESSPSSVFSEG